MSDYDPQKSNEKASSSQLMGVNQLIKDAIINITTIVESMHHQISPISKLTQHLTETQKKGVPGLVYNSIRGVTERVGKGLDIPLELISKSMKEITPSSKAEGLKSALNGILGDHLVERNNPLAISMAFRQNGKKLEDLTPLLESVKRADGKLVILVHGLCMNDIQWSREGHDHGAALTADLGCPAIYLHYNSGQHISDNGTEFSHSLEALLNGFSADKTLPNLHISIVAHSMGGLVARSAFEQSKSLSHQWPKYAKKLVFLGTPHHGAPLEKAGGWVDMLLGIHSYTAPLTELTTVRSAGINDLRHGYIVHTDWQKRGPFDFAVDKRLPLCLPQDTDCYAIGTNVSSSNNIVSSQMLGDGLVPLDSALGKHSDGRFTLRFPKGHTWTGKNINHMQLLSDQDVYAVLKSWLEEG